ncbi:hypothetical protein CKJ65_25595 [Mycobacterium intracellulare]|uniref:AIPR family protein n=1 Tax=Mycobacterium intracellulare TaxID=1767 RepID=UPI000BB00B00|nr:AIPR family protein [Mycobacterium intracellulare]PBA28932.1 hypothetical protein CKJ65_25595 [Mycobacterium intracellulare]
MPQVATIDHIRRRVQEIQQDYPGLATEGDAFAVWSIAFIHKLSLDDAIECAATRGQVGTGDGGVDGVVVDEADGVVYLIQCKYSDHDSANFDATALSELNTGLNRMLSPIYSEQIGGEFAKKAEQVRAALSGNADLILEVVILGSATQSLLSAAASVSRESPDLKVQGEVWDIARIDDEWTERTTIRDLADVDVIIRTTGPLIDVPTVGIEGLSSYGIAILDGRSLGDVARTYGPRLVDMNVRYQLRKTKINDAIAQTATNPLEQAQFLVLNNGLTIICDAITESATDHVTLRNPQIVNGAQTALTIGDNVDLIQPDAVKVLARIMVVDKTIDEGPSLARLISEATNRQNPISSADLKAHDRLQIRIESDLKKLPDSWYYERRRNGYASLSNAEKQKFVGKITKEELGQRYRALIGEPAKAVTAKATIFDSTSLYGKIFDDSIPVEMYVLAYQLFEFYHRLLNKPNASLRQDIYVDFDEDTRLLLMRARNQFAAHATALAYFLLARHYKNLSPVRAYQVALDSRDQGVAYRPLHQLVVMTLIKWAISRQQSAIEKGESFNIKYEFESGDTFGLLCQDAKMAVQFFGKQTLDLLPD